MPKMNTMKQSYTKYAKQEVNKNKRSSKKRLGTFDINFNVLLNS